MFAQSAANNIKLDAFIMAPRGAFYLENLNNVGIDKGSMSQFGGQILRGGGDGMATSNNTGYTTREYLYDICMTPAAQFHVASRPTQRKW